MLTLRPTQMLAKRLKIPLPADLPPVENRVADWCVHEFQESGHRYLIFCNMASFYPLVTKSSGVTNGSTLISCFAEVAAKCFEGTELEKLYRDRILPDLVAVQWAPIPGRSVLAAINDLISGAKRRVGDGNFSERLISEFLGCTPLSILGMNSPDRVFSPVKFGG